MNDVECVCVSSEYILFPTHTHAQQTSFIHSMTSAVYIYSVCVCVCVIRTYSVSYTHTRTTDVIHSFNDVCHACVGNRICSDDRHIYMQNDF